MRKIYLDVDSVEENTEKSRLEILFAKKTLIIIRKYDLFDKFMGAACTY